MLNKVFVAFAVTLCGVITMSVPNVGAQADTTSTATASTPTVLKVGSFNLRNASLALKPGIRPWSTRRNVAIRQILAQDLDVLGIQETSFSPKARVKYVHGPNQYIDLTNGLNGRGGNYRLVARAAYNCKKPLRAWGCVYRDQKASAGTRIVYNANRLTPISRGAMPYAVNSGGGQRFLTWAVFQVNATGEQFLFATTHLASSGDAVRVAQWNQLIAKIDEVKGSLPVVVAGDFNTNRNAEAAKTQLPAMREHGYGDVLNQEYMQNPIARPRARSTINGWVNSCNRALVKVNQFSHYENRNLLGVNVDYIFASNWMDVQAWEVVVDFDPITLAVRNILPSDHNLITATLSLG